LNSPQQFQVIVAVHHSGTIREILLYRLNDLIGPYVFMPQVSGTFMLGLAAAKKYAMANLDATKPLALRIL